MSARRTRGGDLKDSKEEEGGEEAEGMAAAEATPESEVKAGNETDKRAADVTLNAESSRESKKQRISTKQASTQFLDSATTKATAYKSAISSMARANESNYITEENYNLLHWLYRTRRASCARGLLIGFLQPDFLWSIYRPMMRSKKLWRTDGNIRVAANLWCYNRAKALKRYGHISDWDVSSVTDMSELFHGYGGDEYEMEGRFRGKDLFNDDISRWDVSNVTNMYGMFCHARAFNQPVGDWDVSKVTCTNEMFCHASSFNQPVGDWDVSKVTDTMAMFWYASAFNQPVGDWDVSKVSDVEGMFCNARSFNQNLTRWDLSSAICLNTEYMFSHADAMQRDNKPTAVRDDVYDDSDDEGEWEEWEEAGAGV